MFALERRGDDDDISSRLLSPLILPRPASEEEEEGRGTIKTLFPGSKKKKRMTAARGIIQSLWIYMMDDGDLGKRGKNPPSLFH